MWVERNRSKLKKNFIHLTHLNFDEFGYDFV